jgi:hypothetical protein
VADAELALGEDVAALIADLGELGEANIAELDALAACAVGEGVAHQAALVTRMRKPFNLRPPAYPARG